MSTENAPQNVKKTLKKRNQQHLLTFWDDLEEAGRKKLLGQIEQLDLSEIDQWVTKVLDSSEKAALKGDFEPAPAYEPHPAGSEQQRKYSKARQLGRKLISDGKVAAFVVAGGQGTRLGFDGPKGDFPISPIKNKTLFQIFAEMIAAASQKYGVKVPWYVMTSPMNHEDVGESFRKNHCWGLDEKDVFIFEQGTLPNFTFDGKILLAARDRIARSPDGHGGCIKALFKSGALDDMKSRGIEYISYFQVDNPLIHIFDPLFIGLHALDEAEMSAKALTKAYPMEKMGNFCLVDGKVMVIEYSDLPEELAKKRREDGSLLFELGSTAIHVFSTSFIERLNYKKIALPLHRAVKKIPHVDEKGRPAEPEETNGVKLETFVFDALPLAENAMILKTMREQEFAPVKNAEGNDSPETAENLMKERAASWLRQAGINVPAKEDGSADCAIEIAPTFALDAEDVKAKADQIPEIKSGQQLYLG